MKKFSKLSLAKKNKVKRQHLKNFKNYGIWKDETDDYFQYYTYPNSGFCDSVEKVEAQINRKIEKRK